MIPYGSMRDNVVITGAGCISSLGIGVETFADELLAGRTGIAPITTFSTEGCRSHAAALVRDFQPSRYIEPMKLRRFDEVGRLALATCRLAIEDARLPTGSDAVGMVMGTATSGLHSTVAHVHRLMTEGPASVPALGFSNTIGNAAASLCSIEFGLHGPNVTIGQKQASALAAIAFASAGLWQGRAAAFICGGVDDIEEQFFRVHDRLGVLSPVDGLEEASRPLDARRNGFVLGTGGHLVVLETSSAAARRGAAVYGEVLGVGASSNDCPLNGWPTEPCGIVRAMTAALTQGGVTADDVTVVFASANSTPALDRAEALAIQQVFGARRVPVVSIKGAVGEFGAVGAASLMAALLCLRRGTLPPTVGFAQPDPGCPVDVSASARPSDGRLALINATADGGAQFSLLVRAFAADEVERRPNLG
jgi:3-oxoacyl-[acyl-carrier-protein] synthase II